ncbi:hypothetical protein B0T10DRAFT_406285 [Thelonectria olida]|uniref:Uncharacterized protein n=1 Tax=Thelonectria olida TaxID=1576542 RepID=A0A9P8W281_9HYPO|nr:hypothetical protein B0T10DRAFT_406285 [Thelonectria olida]
MTTAFQSFIRQSPPVDVTKPYNKATLNNKTILITGGANGLGAHMVREWASNGANIVIGDVADALGEELVADLTTKHPESTFVYQHCDVTDWDSQVALFKAAVRGSPSGCIDIVVPNAGIIIPSASTVFEHPTLVDGELPKPNLKTLEVNITGVAYTTHLALYHLPRNPSPDRCILLIGSLASLIPFPGQPQYVMTKHAVLGLFRTLRATAFLNGVRVNMIAPFYTAKTNMLKAPVEAAFLSGSPGPASIEDVIDAATRLIADEDVAGRCLVIGPHMSARGAEGAEDFEDFMVSENGEGKGRSVWECHAGDYDIVDSFVKRYVYLLYAIEKARGWFGVLSDIWGVIRRK